MKKLCSECQENGKHFKEILRYINGDCSPFLEEIIFEKIPVDCYFNNVGVVKVMGFVDTYLGREIKKCNHWFPNLKKSALIIVIITEPKCIEMKFNSLDAMKLFSSISMVTLRQIMQIIPQSYEFLKSVAIIQEDC